MSTLSSANVTDVNLVLKERTQTSADMGKGRHVVIHDVIHDDNEMGHRPISYQDKFSCIIQATPLFLDNICLMFAVFK